jgi:hypothetical protein
MSVKAQVNSLLLLLMLSRICSVENQKRWSRKGKEETWNTPRS